MYSQSSKRIWNTYCYQCCQRSSFRDNSNTFLSRLGLILQKIFYFLAQNVAMFNTVILAYFLVHSQNSAKNGIKAYPPKIFHLLAQNVALLNTVILACFLTHFQNSAKQWDKKKDKKAKRLATLIPTRAFKGLLESLIN